MRDAVVLWHSDCPDGHGAAWLLKRNWPGRAVTLVPCRYNEPPPEVPDGADIWIVDFSYPPDVVGGWARDHSVVMLDHHQTAAEMWNVPDPPVPVYESVVGYTYGIDPNGSGVVIDQSRSGVGLVSQLVRIARGQNAIVPWWVRHIEDRDLWKFELPETREVMAAITSHPYDYNTWVELEYTPRDVLLAEGAGIERFRQRLIESCVEGARQQSMHGLRDIWIANAPYCVASDVAGELAKRDPGRFAVYYFDSGNTTHFGLRSGPDGTDVAKLAELMGGGGHRHAAGYRWEWGITGIRP